MVQADVLTDAGLSSVVVCPMTSTASDASSFRVRVEPAPDNGLAAHSEIMVEKLAGVSRRRLPEIVGRLDAATMQAVDRALLLVLGFA